jgi:hypothetical protein
MQPTPPAGRPKWSPPNKEFLRTMLSFSIQPIRLVPSSIRGRILRASNVADFSYDRLRPAFLTEIFQEQKSPREPFLARIEQLIDQILLDTTVAGQLDALRRHFDPRRNAFPSNIAHRDVPSRC